MELVSGLLIRKFLHANMYFLLNYDMMDGNKENRENDE